MLCDLVGLSLVLSMCSTYHRSNQLISLKLGVMIGLTSQKNFLTFGGDLVPDTDWGSLFLFPHHCGFYEIYWHFSYSHRSIFVTFGKMTDANKVMNPQHFGSDPAAICIRVWITPEIWIWIPHKVWLRLDALAEVCSLWVLSSYSCVVFIIS